ncbi:MAG: hypothetical protein E7471_05300 [Ruminococcaceae bacterium]|nr:hypothetical protein [Oscillospiraceae bacterium]
MCNFCNCVRNILGCNNEVSDNYCGYDDIDTTVVCGNCQCAADDVCGCDTCGNSAQNNNCDCDCGCGCNNCANTARNTGCGCRCN